MFTFSWSGVAIYTYVCKWVAFIFQRHIKAARCVQLDHSGSSLVAQFWFVHAFYLHLIVLDCAFHELMCDMGEGKYIYILSIKMSTSIFAARMTRCWAVVIEHWAYVCHSSCHCSPCVSTAAVLFIPSDSSQFLRCIVWKMWNCTVGSARCWLASLWNLVVLGKASVGEHIELALLIQTLQCSSKRHSDAQTTIG